MNDEAQAAFGAAAPPRRPPSRAGFWLGGLVIALGVAGAVLWVVLGFVRFGDAVDELQRVTIPGSAQIALGEGSNAVYYEAFDAQDRTPALQISVRAVDGPVVEVGEHSGSVSYAIGGHTGQSVASVRVPRDGEYTVTVDGPPREVSQAIAIGPGVGSRIVRIIVGAILIVLLGGAAGTTLIVLTAARRRRGGQGAAGVALPMR